MASLLSNQFRNAPHFSEGRQRDMLARVRVAHDPLKALDEHKHGKRLKRTDRKFGKHEARTATATSMVEFRGRGHRAPQTNSEIQQAAGSYDRETNPTGKLSSFNDLKDVVAWATSILKELSAALEPVSSRTKYQPHSSDRLYFRTMEEELQNSQRGRGRGRRTWSPW